jgi:hypothetical protein
MNSVTTRKRLRLYKKDSISFLCKISKNIETQKE